MKRRLADKLVDALETAWEQGREDFAYRLDLLRQALLEEESVVTKNRRADDQEFDPENIQSFRENNIYDTSGIEPEDPEAELVEDAQARQQREPGHQSRAGNT